MATNTIHLTIIKQLAAKLTGFGFPNYPKEAIVSDVDDLSQNVKVYRVDGMTAGPVWALVVVKGHTPQPAFHVVDFRVGNNLYA
jgi:hypothetical protein